MDISEPSVLARLPHTSGQSGRSLFAQVYGVRNGVKRKRQEICTAIDGNSVSIYEAQHGRVVSSFPIPPETTFECAPCSTRSRTDIATVRSTYCVTKRRSEVQLQCFSDIIAKDEAKQQKSSAKLAQQQGNVVQVEYVCWPNAAGVLVLWDSGHYSLLTADLSSRISEGRLVLPKPGGSLLACHCTSVLDASKSTLKARPDLAATAGANATVIAGVSQGPYKDVPGPEDLTYCLWIIPHTFMLPSDGMRLTPVLSQVLNVSANFNLRERDGVTFLSKGTRISLRSHTRSATFELASILPQKISELSSLVPDYISTIMISDYLSLFSSSGSLQLYNTQFRSAQASLDLSRSALKRRRGSEPQGPVVFLTYFPQLNRVIGTRRGYLVAIDLHMSQTTDISTAMKRSSMLINNIGKGTPDRGSKSAPQIKNIALGSISKPGMFADTWSSTSKRLEEYVSKQDVDQFEDLFLQHASTRTYSEEAEGKNHSPNGEIDYVLSKLLQSVDDNADSADDNACTLRINLPARRLLQWLTVEGYMTVNRITKALFASSRSDINRALKPGSIIHALSDFDPSLTFVKQFLHDAPCIDSRTLCAAIRLFIRKALTLSDSSATQAIQTKRVEAKFDMVNSDALAKLPEEVLSNHISVADVASMLIKALERLSERDSRTISASLRANLEQQDLVALIQFLRQQLFQNGYTRSLQNQTYPSPPASIDGVSKDIVTTASVDSDLSLDAMLSVMSSCVDIIGPLGLIDSAGDMQFIQTLIPELSSEITRTMEALDDASYLQGLLRETLRYSASMKGYPNKADEDNEDSSKPTGTITTIYAESATDQAIANNTSALPLSLHADNKVDTVRIRKGGGQIIERSKREMGMLQDRLRAPYAVERLVL